MKAQKQKIFRSVEEVFDHYVGKQEVSRGEEDFSNRRNGIHLAEELIKRFQKVISGSKGDRGANRQKRPNKK